MINKQLLQTNFHVSDAHADLLPCKQVMGFFSKRNTYKYHDIILEEIHDIHFHVIEDHEQLLYILCNINVHWVYMDDMQTCIWSDLMDVTIQ